MPPAPPVVPLLMVLPASPPLAAPASWVLALRPELLQAGTTMAATMIAVALGILRKLSMRCRTSVSLITHDHGTAFAVHRMLKKTGGSGAFLGKAELCACLWSVSLFCCLLPRIPEEHRDDASDVVTVFCSLSLIKLLFLLAKGPFSPGIAL